MRDFWFNVVYTSSAKVYSMIVAFIILTITARWLGPEGRGTIAAVETWVGLFATFGHLSLGQVAIHRATELRNQPWLASTLGSLLFLTGFITLIGWVIAFGLYLATGTEIYNNLSPLVLLVGFLILPLMIWEQYGSSLLMAVDRVTIYNKVRVTGLSVGLLLIVLAWWRAWGVVGVLAANLLGQAVVATVSIGYLFRQAKQSIWPDKATITTLLGGGLRLHWNAIGSFLILSTDILILNLYRGPTEVGYYQLAVQLMLVMMVVPSSASMLLTGKVAQLGPDGAWVYQRKVILFLTLGMIGGAIIAAFVAPWAIPLVVGDEFAPAIPVFQLLLLALIGLSFSIIMTPQWIGRGLFLQVSGMSLAIGLLNLVAGLWLIPYWGMYGAVASTLITYVISVFINGGMAVWCEVRFRRTQIPFEQQAVAVASGADYD